MDAKNECEQHILWKVGKGNLSFWWDNWSNKGALANILHQRNKSKKVRVFEFFSNSQWNLDKLHANLPANLIPHILSIKLSTDKKDQPVWTPDHTRVFSSKPAWSTLRKFKGSSLTLSKIWHKKLPFKVSFHMLKLLNGKLDTDDSLTRFGVHG